LVSRAVLDSIFEREIRVAALFESDLVNLDEERVLDLLGRTSLGCVAKIGFRNVD